MQQCDEDAAQTEGCGYGGEVSRDVVHPVQGVGERAVGVNDNL